MNFRALPRPWLNFNRERSANSAWAVHTKAYRSHRDQRSGRRPVVTTRCELLPRECAPSSFSSARWAPSRQLPGSIFSIVLRRFLSIFVLFFHAVALTLFLPQTLPWFRQSSAKKVKSVPAPRFSLSSSSFIASERSTNATYSKYTRASPQNDKITGMKRKIEENLQRQVQSQWLSEKLIKGSDLDAMFTYE